MMRVSPIVAALLCLGVVSGCGSTAPVDFFDSNGGGAGAAGATASAGSPPLGTAGATMLGGAGATMLGGAGATMGSAGATMGPSDAPCSPAKDLSNHMSGELGTTDAVCLRVTDEVIGWGCSNFEGRTVKVNGVQVGCAQVPLPDKVHGAYYFEISAGQFSYASFYWWSA